MKLTFPSTVQIVEVEVYDVAVVVPVYDVMVVVSVVIVPVSKVEF